MSNAYHAGAVKALSKLRLLKQANVNYSNMASNADEGAKAGKGFLAFARRNPVGAGLAIGGATGLGMGAHALMTGKNLSPEPNVTYNYPGSANPML